MEASVRDIVLRYMDEEYGNAGSRTHEYGANAKAAVERARDQVAAVVAAKRDEVIFTSGATEANNLAVLGLVEAGARGRRHIVSTAIEHKAVLEPLDVLRRRGFEVDLVLPTKGGWIDPAAISSVLRPDTFLVSVMHANNETGVCQPIDKICGVLENHPAYLHVDAAQGFGKELPTLQLPRIDLISISGHKIYGPKGVGSLVARKRGFERVPLAPLAYGGGQERGLRPGTIPVALVAGLGAAAELAVRTARERSQACIAFRDRLLTAIAPLKPHHNGDPSRALPHVVNVSFAGVDSEAAIVALKDIVAVSNGSACTSHSYEPSHVLRAMGLPDETIAGALRLSWSHLTPDPDWPAFVAAIRALFS